MLGLTNDSERNGNMNYQMTRIMVTAAMFLLTAFSVCASPLTPVVKAGVKATEKAGAHAGGKAVVRGGAAFAAATARHETAKTATRTAAGKIAENVTPGRILAVGGHRL